MARGIVLVTGAGGIAAALGFALGHATATVAASSAPLVVAAAAGPLFPSTITVSDQEASHLQLRFGKAQVAPLVRTVSTTGTVGYDQLRLARITPPARGRIETLDVTVGDQVASGQRLAVLDNFELSAVRSQVSSANAAVTQAQAQVATANAALNRAENLVRTCGMAQSEVEVRRAAAAGMEAELRTRQAELRQYEEEEARLMPVNATSTKASTVTDPSETAASIATNGHLDSPGAIVAPFKGIVDSVAATQGEIVGPSTRVFTVADLSTVWVNSDVPESDLGAVVVGDAVKVQVSAYPDRIFAGRVTYISDRIDPSTGTAKVRCAVPNPDGALRINMFARTSIISPVGRDAVQVPSSALQDVNSQTVVFIPTTPGHFTWHAVQTGLVANGQTQISGGLAAGTAVVTDGSYWLKAALMQSTIPDEG
jgi:membrane fusion protein, heavy metal efflux system